MTTLDLEAEYNNRARVADSADIIARWTKAAAKAKAELPGDRNIAYGPKPRQVYDFYPAAAGEEHGPLVVYIHGGYWQRGHGHDYAFVAKELVASGISVAIPSYTLCPEISIAGIVVELGQFLSALWTRMGRRPVIVGHSAGGQVAASLMAAPITGDVPHDLLKAAYALSGVYDLPPLIPTSLNAALRLDQPTAHAASPLFGPKPAHSCRFVAAVGADESSEFLRQARDLAAAWNGSSVCAEYAPIAGTNHFTIVDELCRPGSRVFDTVAGMARAVA